MYESSLGNLFTNTSVDTCSATSVVSRVLGTNISEFSVLNKLNYTSKNSRKTAVENILLYFIENCIAPYC